MYEWVLMYELGMMYEWVLMYKWVLMYVWMSNDVPTTEITRRQQVQEENVTTFDTVGWCRTIEWYDSWLWTVVDSVENEQWMEHCQ